MRTSLLIGMVRAALQEFVAKQMSAQPSPPKQKEKKQKDKRQEDKPVVQINLPPPLQGQAIKDLPLIYAALRCVSVEGLDAYPGGVDLLDKIISRLDRMGIREKDLGRVDGRVIHKTIESLDELAELAMELQDIRTAPLPELAARVEASLQ